MVDFTENDVRSPPGPEAVPLPVHAMKSNSREFIEILRDNKRHEMRKNDRDPRIFHGDFLRLREWRSDDGEDRYTGRDILVVVTHVNQVEGMEISGGFDVVMSFEPIAFTSMLVIGWVPWSGRDRYL